MPSPKIAKAKTIPNKDGYGAHWHSVGWIAAIAIALSGSAMTLSATAATTPSITPTVLYRSLNDVKAQLTRIEGKLDRLAATAVPTDKTGLTPIPTNSISAPPSALTVCRQACENTLNACATAAGSDQSKYAACKADYTSCWEKCGQ